MLSPWRCRHARGPQYEGHMVTDVPNELLGTDGTRIFTLEDGVERAEHQVASHGLPVVDIRRLGLLDAMNAGTIERAR